MNELAPKDIHPTLTKAYRDQLPPAVRKWAAEFKGRRTSLEDGPHEGRPKNTITPKIIEKVYDIVLDDVRVKMFETAEAVGIPVEKVRNILHKESSVQDESRICWMSVKSKPANDFRNNFLTIWIEEHGQVT